MLADPERERRWQEILARAEAVVKSNPHHEPAGSPAGGQFAPGDGSGGSGGSGSGKGGKKLELPKTYSGKDASPKMVAAGLVVDNPLPRSKEVEFADVDKLFLAGVFKKDGKSVTVNIDDLKTVQDFLVPDQVKVYALPKNEQPGGLTTAPIATIRVGDERVVLDGTHRLAAEKTQGRVGDIVVNNFGEWQKSSSGEWSHAEGAGGDKPAGGQADHKILGSGKNHGVIEGAVRSLPSRIYEKVKDVTFFSQPTIGLSASTGKSGVAGRYSKGLHGERSILIADVAGDRKVKGPVGVLYHEIGHAIDDVEGLSSRLAQILIADADKMKPEEKYLAKYWINHGPRELFAESFRLAYSTDKKGGFSMGQKRAEKVFAKSLAAIREAVG
jgi:hypothetical protein